LLFEAHSLASFKRILGSSLNNIFEKNNQANPEKVEKLGGDLGYKERGYQEYIFNKR
jgi:hypothetical protein